MQKNTERVISFFSEIARIPRESGHEEKIIEYLQRFAASRSLECSTDASGNVLIKAPATAGLESAPVIVLQSHTDMVCEKVAGSDFDFSKDPIKYVIEDGWMVAHETTLGADNGIGIAAALAVMDDPSAAHPALECLFTTSEETGLDGARGLQRGFLSGRTLINLDDEDEGCFCVGCAGGMDTTGIFKYREKKLPKGSVITAFSVSGGLGGHSGDDIGRNRMNAVQQTGRFLDLALDCGAALCSIEAGNKRNAIARSGRLVLATPARREDEVVELFNGFASQVREEFKITDPYVTFSAEPIFWNGNAVDSATARNLARALIAIPHGVIAMSADIEGLIQTSTNLASVRMEPGNRIVVGTMQRSSVNSERLFLSKRVAAVFGLARADVECSDGYPGWKPDMHSAIKDKAVAAYVRLFGREPVVRAIHAGLECGLFTEKFPDMDMISFGPTLRGVHAPGERLDLASLDRFYAVLLEILKTSGLN